MGGGEIRKRGGGEREAVVSVELGGLAMVGQVNDTVGWNQNPFEFIAIQQC